MSQNGVVGWAVVEGGQIKLRTVSDTRRAAIVNFLVTDRDRMFFVHTTDEEIEREWWRLKGAAEIEYVTITRGAAH